MGLVGVENPAFGGRSAAGPAGETQVIAQSLLADSHSVQLTLYTCVQKAFYFVKKFIKAAVFPHRAMQRLLAYIEEPDYLNGWLFPQNA